MPDWYTSKNLDRKKSRITLSLKQLEEDLLLETLDKLIIQNGSLNSNSSSADNISEIEPLPGLKTIIGELPRENGREHSIVKHNANRTRKGLRLRQGFEKRVVSQDLKLWLSNAPPISYQFPLLARAGRQTYGLGNRTVRTKSLELQIGRSDFGKVPFFSDWYEEFVSA
ncbi:hypothetical protein LguiA_025848 [Lonicera macranthoides]